ncbi:MAG: hypothetical protein OEU26_02150 [Candidatus Tectomicrobia bacterium]|nr:hypothetical protein [Candidatus Tectomicrobia bacterium]
MPKDLAAQLRRQEKAETMQVEAAPPAAPPQKTTAPKRQDRQGMVNIAAWFPVRVKFELEEIRLERSRHFGRKVLMQEILAEAYNDLFKKYGKPEMAPVMEEEGGL